MYYLPIPTIPAFPLLRQRHLVLNKIKIKEIEFLLETQTFIILIYVRNLIVYTLDISNFDLLIVYNS